MTSLPVDRTYDVLRVPIRLLSVEPGIGALLDRLCSGFAVTEAEPAVELSVEPLGSTYALYRDGQRLSGPAPLDSAVMGLLQGLNEEAITRTPLWTVHAGVVARGGSAVAFPGPSGFGKSTFVGACLRAGFDYVSDEALAIDPGTFEVVPYPKPLWMADWSLGRFGLAPEDLTVAAYGHKAAVTPQDLGGFGVGGTVHLAGVALLSRHAGVVDLRQARPSQIARSLFENTFFLDRDVESTFRRSARLASSVGGWSLDFGDPEAGAAALASALA